MTELADGKIFQSLKLVDEKPSLVAKLPLISKAETMEQINY